MSAGRAPLPCPVQRYPHSRCPVCLSRSPARSSSRSISSCTGAYGIMPQPTGRTASTSSGRVRRSSGRWTCSRPTTWRRRGRRLDFSSPARERNWKRPARPCARTTKTLDSIRTLNPSGRTRRAIRSTSRRRSSSGSGDAAARDRDAHVLALLLRRAGRDPGVVRSGPASGAADRGPRRYRDALHRLPA